MSGQDEAGRPRAEADEEVPPSGEGQDPGLEAPALNQAGEEEEAVGGGLEEAKEVLAEAQV